MIKKLSLYLVFFIEILGKLVCTFLEWNSAKFLPLFACVKSYSFLASL